MFTGIVALAKIENIIKQNTGCELVISANELVNKVELGSSVAIDGVCLSVTKIENNNLHFFVSTETIDKTIITQYVPQRKINVELPTQVGGYLGGHYVLGHVDAKAVVSKIVETPTAWFLSLTIPKQFCKYVVYKGSITINGISLTVNNIVDNVVELCIIPITLEKTNISQLIENDCVNVEFDILAKYTEKLLTKND